MELTEESMRYLEEHIPELAESAFKQAFWQALAAGNSVLMREGDHLVEIFPDGSRTVLEALPPLTPVAPGQRIERR